VTLLLEGGGRYDLAKSIWEFTHKEFCEEKTHVETRDSG
jgi:hypothetical protein